MPIYEFECKKCDLEFEFLIEGNSKAECPNCESITVERQLSVIASPKSSSSSNCGTPMPGGGCDLPRCGTGGG